MMSDMIKTRKFSTATGSTRIKATYMSRVLVVPYSYDLGTWENHELAASLVSGLPKENLELVSQDHAGFTLREKQPKCLGYRNHETAQVCLQVSNERDLYDRVRAMKQEDFAFESWCDLVEKLTLKPWSKGLKANVKGIDIQWGSPLICRQEVLDHCKEIAKD